MTQYPELPLTPEENPQYAPVPDYKEDEDAYWAWVDAEVDRAKEDRIFGREDT